VSQSVEWDKGFVAGVLSAMQCVAFAEGHDSTLSNEIARACSPKLLVQHADVHDIDLLRKTKATRGFVRSLRRQRA
jgi:hypothetical protein